MEIIKHYLFLDFDGVINTHRSLYKRLAGYYDIPYTEEDFGEEFWDSADGVNPKLMRKIEEVENSGEYKRAKVSFHYYPFDNICIDNCNRIIKENDAEIVVISSWRTGRTIEELQNILNSIGLYGRVIGRTGRKDTRALEIYEWINYHEDKYNTKIESICILDDEHYYDIDYMLGDFTVKNINSLKNGLRDIHIPEAKEIFNKHFDIKNIDPNSKR
jgi:hypothetical protein